MTVFLKPSLLVLLCLLFPYTHQAQNKSFSSNVLQIEKTWELPEILEEISAMAWLSKNQIACIQDEDGIIFIYDLEKEKITEEIKFGDAGDYEGLAISGNKAFVMRSDGRVFEVSNFRKENQKTTSFKTPFKAKNNMESLTIDATGNYLITVPKDKSLHKKRFKGLYKISLTERKIIEKPFLQIDMKAEGFKKYRKKKLRKVFRPSDVVIHPKTEDFYILEGIKPKLLILDKKGTIKNIYKLDKKDFAQPEGIIFNPDGTLYISNEANGGTPTILEVKLQ